MFRDDSQSMKLQRLVDAEFGGTDTIFILVKIDQDVNDNTRIQDIRHPDILKAVSDLKTSLGSETFVSSLGQFSHHLCLRISSAVFRIPFVNTGSSEAIFLISAIFDLLNRSLGCPSIVGFSKTERSHLGVPVGILILKVSLHADGSLSPYKIYPTRQ